MISIKASCPFHRRVWQVDAWRDTGCSPRPVRFASATSFSFRFPSVRDWHDHCRAVESNRKVTGNDARPGVPSQGIGVSGSLKAMYRAVPYGTASCGFGGFCPVWQRLQHAESNLDNQQGDDDPAHSRGEAVEHPGRKQHAPRSIIAAENRHVEMKPYD